MAKTVYAAQATVTGGRAEGHGMTTDGALDVQLRTPVERAVRAASREPGAAVCGGLRGVL